jgi:hypothetical protein
MAKIAEQAERYDGKLYTYTHIYIYTDKRNVLEMVTYMKDVAKVNFQIYIYNIYNDNLYKNVVGR